MSSAPRSPVAIPLSETNQEAPSEAPFEPRGPQVFDPPDPPPAALVIEALADRKRAGIRWGRLFAAALGGLFSLIIGVWFWNAIGQLFQRFSWLGWVAVGFAGLAALAGVAIIIRELRATWRLREITSLRNKVANTGRLVSLKDARNLVHDIEGLYAERTDLASAHASMQSQRGEIMDGADLLALCERDLIGVLDQRAMDMVAASARRVSVVTAVSPRALIDVAFVLWENARLISRIAAMYGGRPGRLSFFGLARRSIEHLAVTSSIAIGDSIIQQALGHGLTARISARLGEGVVNGMLTSRVGLAAIAVCRPMPFSALAEPSISKVMGGVLSSARAASSEKSEKT